VLGSKENPTFKQKIGKLLNDGTFSRKLKSSELVKIENNVKRLQKRKLVKKAVNSSL
jgi:hypothetical protein